MLASRRAILIPTMLVAAGTALSAVAAGPSLDVSPLISQADTPIHIRASGLQPGGLATISAVTRDGSGNHWRSSVTCKADAAGRVDLARCAPVHGSKSTYAIVDDMGLFWSMRQQDGDSTFFQFPAEPSAVYELALELHGKVVERMPIERRLMSDGVARVPLTKHDDGIVGTAFEPTWAPNARDPQSHRPERSISRGHNSRRIGWSPPVGRVGRAACLAWVRNAESRLLQRPRFA